MRKIILSFLLLVIGATAFSQESFPINGVRDLRTGVYAFTNATITTFSGAIASVNGTAIVAVVPLTDAVAPEMTVPSDALRTSTAVTAETTVYVMLAVYEPALTVV